MFNLSGSEIIFLVIIALVVFGPDRLPEMMRRAGRVYSEIRKVSHGFQSEFRSAFDEPMNEARSTADLLRQAATLPDAVKGAVTGATAATPAADSAAPPATDPPAVDPVVAAEAASAGGPASPSDDTASGEGEAEAGTG